MSKSRTTRVIIGRSNERGMADPAQPGLKDAMRRLDEGRTGPPSCDDTPPLSTFPGRKQEALPGQLPLDLSVPTL